MLEALGNRLFVRLSDILTSFNAYSDFQFGIP
jgi:hypothetical protein